MTIYWKYLSLLLCIINWNKWEGVLESSANEVVVWDEIGKERRGHVVSPNIFWLMSVYPQMLLLVNMEIAFYYLGSEDHDGLPELKFYPWKISIHVVHMYADLVHIYVGLIL